MEEPGEVSEPRAAKTEVEGEKPLDARKKRPRRRKVSASPEKGSDSAEASVSRESHPEPKPDSGRSRDAREAREPREPRERPKLPPDAKAVIFWPDAQEPEPEPRRDRERGSLRDRDRDRDREPRPERERDREPRSDRDRDRAPRSDRDSNRDSNRDREPGRDRNRHRDLDRDRDRESSKDRDSNRDRDPRSERDARDSRTDGEGSTGRKRSKRSRSRRKSKAGLGEDGARTERAPLHEDSARSGSKKTAKKRSRRKAGRAKQEDLEDDDLDRDEHDEEHDLDRDDDRDEGTSQGGRKRRSSKKRGKVTKSVEELEEEEEVVRTKSILVNASEPEERRVVLVGENGRIEDLLMTAESQKNLVNDIYRGKVVNLEPAIGAAFVDFGQGRNGFLHTSDVMPVYGEADFTLEKLLTTRMEDDDDHPDLDDEDDDHDRDEDDEDADGESRPARSKSPRKEAKKKPAAQRRSRQRLPITDLLSVGDQVVVQITKDAIGDKGPTLTTYISIPGRYLVLMPSMARTGVSRKIPDENERRRLKRILAQLDAPEEMGVIVRTAGVGKLKSDLKRDLNYLLGVWKTFEDKLKTGRGPTPLYQESDVATRTLRDLFNKETKEVIVDDFAVHEQMVEFAERLMPEHVHRIQRYEGQRPIFHHYSLEQDFEQIFNRRVELPSGGSIVFDQAEALVAIDVNSGRTRTGSHDFEEIALKTNLEAVPEIALQIRLRDLGGIIVCDFIDMMKSSSNRAVERALRTELVKDRARSKMGRIGQFGLIELTRQRLGPGTHKKVFQACPRCRGTGRVRTVQSRAQAILRRLGSALTQKGFSTIEVKAHPEVVDYIKEHLWDYIRALEHRFEREVRVVPATDQSEDSVLRYMRTDGREVRPGGRRKR